MLEAFCSIFLKNFRMKLNIRAATLQDLPTLLEFEQGVIEAERPMDPRIRNEKVHYYDLLDLMENPDNCLLVGELDGRIITCGYAKIMEDRPYLNHSHFAYLGFMFVPEADRGKGYNQQLLNGLIQWCHSRNIKEIRLDVYTVNEPALRAYAKAGFEPYLLNMRLKD